MHQVKSNSSSLKWSIFPFQKIIPNFNALKVICEKKKRKISWGGFCLMCLNFLNLGSWVNLLQQKPEAQGESDNSSGN